MLVAASTGIEVQQRFTHAHQHDVGDGLPFCGKVGIGNSHLAHNFCGLQIAVKALLARGAKAAVEYAADLRRHTQRVSSFVRYQHRFNEIPLAYTNEPFHRAVLRQITLMDLRQFPTAVLLQPLSGSLRKVRHRGKIDRALVIGPFHDLPTAKRLQAELLKQGLQLTAV
jgi:hypothetical protein